MAKKRSKSRSLSRAGIFTSAMDALRGIDGSAVRRRGSIVAWVAMASGLGVAWFLGVPRLTAYAQVQLDEPVSVRFVDPPAWMNGDLEALLEVTAARHIEGSPLDRDGLVAARQALMETGWFIEVSQVRRAELGEVAVHAVFVDPYAVVRDGEGDHLVDRSGRLLPRSVPAGQATHFKFVQGASQPRPHRAGEPWPGGDVTAALRLLRLIEQRPWRQQVAGVDVSSYAAQQAVSLITDRGRRIRWGRPPGEETAGEVTTEQKLYYLDYPFKHFGHIDGGHDGELDITTSVGVIVR